MPLVALICAGLLGMVDVATPPLDVAAEYQRVKAKSGQTSDDQVRLALWCEAHGLLAERMRHLALAVLADPANASARGLSGLVARNGHWLAPDAVTEAVQADKPTSAVLAEYDARRSETAYIARAQWDLAQWADQHCLKDQAKAHFSAETRLNANSDQAWQRLGHKKFAGKWETEAQVAADKAEAEAVKQADQHWYPILLKCRAMLDHPAERVEAQATLKGLTDPYATSTVWSLFGYGSADQQLAAVELFSQLQGGPATVALSDLAIHGRSPEVLQTALDRWIERDPRDSIESLILQMRNPWKFEVHPLAGAGSTGSVLVEGEGN